MAPGNFVRFKDYDGYLKWAGQTTLRPCDVIGHELASRTFRVVKVDADSVMLLLPVGYSGFIPVEFMERVDNGQ